MTRSDRSRESPNPSGIGRLLRKSAASVRRRWHVHVGSGFSVARARGVRFLVDWRHGVDRKVAVGLYEVEQVEALDRLIDRSGASTFVDIGAHSGLYSIVLKRRHPDLEVHAFEPDATNRAQLHANLFLNGLERAVRVHPFGLSDRDGTASFDTAVRSTTRGTRRIAADGDATIEVRRLDSTLTDRGRTVLVKIDVEGHEAAVLEGGAAFLDGNRVVMQVESMPERLDEVRRRLAALGYRHLRSIGSFDHHFTNLAESDLRA